LSRIAKFLTSEDTPIAWEEPRFVEIVGNDFGCSSFHVISAGKFTGLVDGDNTSRIALNPLLNFLGIIRKIGPSGCILWELWGGKSSR
jgi:hypothetical protein